MALPITQLSPNTIGFSSSTGGSWIASSQRTKQARPYDMPAAYHRFMRYELDFYSAGVIPYNTTDLYSVQSYPERRVFTHKPGDGYNCYSFYQNEIELAQNRALDWLRSELGAQASTGIALVQANQALEMILKRTQSLYKFVTRLKRFDVGGAFRALELSPKNLKKLTSKEAKLKSGAKHFASNFLEVHFGWAPLIGDIYDAIDTLQSPIPLGKVRGVGAQPIDKNYHWNYTNPISEARGKVDIYSSHVGKVRVRCGCEVQVDNPNLYLANRLGLTNPALIVYDAIPFSFVVNWFITVEQFLSGMGMFAGLTVSNTWMNVSLTDTCSTELHYSAPYWGEGGVQRQTSTGKSFVRTTALPGYAIARKPVIITSATRALTAVSLLVQKGFKV